MPKKINRILLAIDGSDQAMNAVKYISKTVSPEQNELVIFHVYQEVPDPFLDLNIHPAFNAGIPLVKAWELSEQKGIREFIKKAFKVIIESGFNNESVKVKTQPEKIGIARDILYEAKQGYHAVVIGRSGISDHPGFSFGSVTSKIIEKFHHATLIVVGGEPETDKILIAYDGSRNAKKGIIDVGSILGNSKKNIMICHVIRPLGIIHKGDEQTFSHEHELEWLKTVKTQYKASFFNARFDLANEGLSWGRISSKIISNKTSRAIGIVEEARINAYGTIVVGRRGHTVVKDFFMGRVCNKILQIVHTYRIAYFPDHAIKKIIKIQGIPV